MAQSRSCLHSLGPEVGILHILGAHGLGPMKRRPDAVEHSLRGVAHKGQLVQASAQLAVPGRVHMNAGNIRLKPEVNHMCVCVYTYIETGPNKCSCHLMLRHSGGIRIV